MREVVLTIPRLAVEDVLDRLLPIVPGGVRERRSGPHVELRLRGEEVPDAEEIAAAIGRWPHTLSEHEISDDWRRRRLDDYEPDLIGGRLVVRPEWAPPAAAGLIGIELGEGAAFGGGTSCRRTFGAACAWRGVSRSAAGRSCSSSAAEQRAGHRCRMYTSPHSPRLSR